MSNEVVLIKAIQAILSVAESNNLVRIKQICLETLSEIKND